MRLRQWYRDTLAACLGLMLLLTLLYATAGAYETMVILDHGYDQYPD